MRVDTSFTISRPPAETYARLLELEQVTPCFPGAQLGEELPDGGRAVRVTVKLGPMKLAYDGEVRIAARDDDALRAVLAGAAREARGAGSATARITMRVEPAGAGSQVIAEADIDLTGRAAQMGKGIVESVAQTLVGQMAACLETTFAAAAPAAPPETGADSEMPDAVAAAPPAPATAPSVTPPPTAPAPASLDGGRLMLTVLRDRYRRTNLAHIVSRALPTVRRLADRLPGRARHDD